MQVAKSVILLTAPILLEGVYYTKSPAVREWAVSLLARTAYLASVPKRRRNERALRSYFQGRLSDAEIRQTNLAHFKTFWRDVVETIRFESETASLRRVEIAGLDHLENALAEGRGCILWESNSFGRRNLAKQVLALHGYQLEQVHLKGHLLGLGSSLPVPRWVSQFASRFLLKWECQFISKLYEIPLDGSLAYLRGMSKSLARNQIICSAGDGSHGQRRIEFGFLGGVLHISTGMLSLSAMSGAPIIPIFCYSKGSNEYRVELSDPIRLSGREDREAEYYRAAGEYTRALEERSLSYPNQRFVWPSPAGDSQPSAE